jgi:hypothetical protein
MQTGTIALAISATVVTVYHALWQPPPELGITPEMFDWSPVWVGRVAGFVVSTLVLAFVIGMAMKFVRWLAGLRDLS